MIYCLPIFPFWPYLHGKSKFHRHRLQPTLPPSCNHFGFDIGDMLNYAREDPLHIHTYTILKPTKYIITTKNWQQTSDETHSGVSTCIFLLSIISYYTLKACLLFHFTQKEKKKKTLNQIST